MDGIEEDVPVETCMWFASANPFEFDIWVGRAVKVINHRRVVFMGCGKTQTDAIVDTLLKIQSQDRATSPEMNH